MITLDEYTEAKLDNQNNIVSWRKGEHVKDFLSIRQAVDYIDKHLAELPENIVFFTGSASTLTYLNNYLKEARAKL